MKISGTFSVELKPQEPYFSGGNGNNLGRMSIDKKFEGPLSGTSRGEMLSLRTATEGSAGYTAIECVEGSLSGKAGGFALQHFGIMDGTDHRLILEVVPKSGFGELQGISGSMTIDMKDGLHHYEFDYALG